MTAQPTIPVRGKILVVDDNPIIQRAVYFALRDQGFKVFMSGEIHEAIGILRKEKPDLIFLDLSFPADGTNIGGPLRDGFFFIDWVRRTPEIEKTPIVIVSASAPESYQERVVAAGIKVCLQKPLNKTALMEAIEFMIGNKIAGEPPDQSPMIQ